MSWTDERVALLKKLWVEGKTAAEIAKELGNVTRNAVIGKAHRLKLSNRVSPIQQNNKKPVSPPRKPEKKIQVLQEKYEEAAPTTKGMPLEDLNAQMCRWPQGDPRDDNFSFCGGESLNGLPYCAHHTKMAYQAATRNRIFQDGDAAGAGKPSKKSA
ncbi:MAG: GcrA family cell cycle regulator [Alphaproteobacteria bacterium]